MDSSVEAVPVLRVSPDARSYICRPCLSPYSLPRVGEVVGGKYKIVSADSQSQSREKHLYLGAGGGGRVYLAEDLEQGGRIVAIKFYKNDDDENCNNPFWGKVRSRFEHEGTLLSKYGRNAVDGSRNLPAYFGQGKYGSVGRPYIVMERLHSIDADIQANLDRLDKIILKICDAVQFLLTRKIIPIDLKIDNIMKRTDGELVLIDLGLVDDNSIWARDERGKRYEYLKSLVGLGTPGYIPPYQNITESTAIYAIGSIIDWCFRGRSLPQEWHKIVTRCHRLDQTQCYKSIEELSRSVRFARADLKITAMGISTRAYHNRLNRLVEDDRALDIVEISWAEAILDKKVKNSCMWQRECKRKIEQYSHAKLGDMVCSSWVHRKEEEISKYGVSVDEVEAQTRGDGWIKDDSGRIVVSSANDGVVVVDCGNPLRRHHVLVKDPIFVENPILIIFNGNGVINVDLTAVKGTRIVVGRETTLINRTRMSTKDLSEYHLNSLGYLNFLHANPIETAEIERRVYHSLYGPSFVRINGPQTIGDLLRQQDTAITESRAGAPISWSTTETTMKFSTVIGMIG